MGRFAIFVRKIALWRVCNFGPQKIVLWRVCNFGPQKLHYEGFAVLVHKKLYEGLQFLREKLHLGDNNSCWVFVDVGIEVTDHVKFPVCLCLKRLLLLVCDFPTVVSEPGSDQGFIIKGGRGAVWHIDQNQRPLKRVEFMCGEMLPDLQRRLQMVLMWPNEWCTMEILSVWVVVCDMCVEEVLCGLQICSGCCVRWTVMFGNVGSTWWGWSSRSPMVVFCMAHAMLSQQRVLCHCVVAVSWLDQGGIMMDYPWVSVNY